jgi:aminopeptidase N
VFHTDDGMVVVGEPRVAATWFPSNDHPADKATMTLRMTVQDGLEVIGNGRLVGVTPAAAGTSTWEWRMDQPMAPYLATATVGDYATSSTVVDGITYYDAIAQSLVGTAAGDEAAAQFAKEPAVVAYLSTLFGPYPFTESGGLAVDVPDLGFALENQTRPIYPGAPDESTLVHELAHQWYGDDVSLSRWQDIWLNEGFATYAEWMWSEHVGGDTAQQLFDQQYALSAGSSFWTGVVADPGPAGIFDSYTYNRGAMTLHQLRLAVGDAAFLAILQGWASGHADGNGTTEEFIAYAEQVSGQDLGDLFTAWLYTPSKPVL